MRTVTRGLEELSRITHIPILDFRQVLRHPISVVCTAQNVSEARDQYLNASIHSDARGAALVRWNELSLVQAETAQTLSQVIAAYTMAPDNSKAQEVAIEKWISLCESFADMQNLYEQTHVNTESFFIKWMSFCTSSHQFREIEKRCFNDQVRVGLFRKWNELLLKRVEEAQTIDAIQHVYYDIPNFAEAWSVAVKKWNKFIFEAIETAQNLEQLEAVNLDIPFNSTEASIALEMKGVGFCITLEEIAGWYRDVCITQQGREACLRKMCEIYFAT